MSFVCMIPLQHRPYSERISQQTHSSTYDVAFDEVSLQSCLTVCANAGSNVHKMLSSCFISLLVLNLLTCKGTNANPGSANLLKQPVCPSAINAIALIMSADKKCVQDLRIVDKEDDHSKCDQKVKASKEVLNFNSVKIQTQPELPRNIRFPQQRERKSEMIFAVQQLLQTTGSTIPSEIITELIPKTISSCNRNVM
eukprot:2620422-Amphidinium_carterae.1